MIQQPKTEDTMRDEMRLLLKTLDENLNNLTDRYFSDEDRETLKEQIGVWRWYLSHGYFPKGYEHLNTPESKPSFQYLYNLMTTGRAMRDLIALCAAPLAKDSLDLRYGSDYLKMVISRILVYQEPIPIPKSFYLPLEHPNKTDQEGIPWAKSTCDAAKKWRKQKEAERKAREEKMQPKQEEVITQEEYDRRMKEHLDKKNKQREMFAQQRQDALKEAERKHELAEAQRRRMHGS